TLPDLLAQMVTETVVRTFLPELDLEEQIENNRLARLPLEELLDTHDKLHVKRVGASEDLALALGFAFAMTLDQAVRGPEAWYQAAIEYAGVTLRSEDDLKAAYARLDDAVVENARLHGYTIKRIAS